MDIATATTTKRLPAYRRLANTILEEILDGRLREGDVLPTEARLCETYGVNRSTVREGIRALEEANLIRRENNSKKLYVSRPSNEETGAHLERILVLQETTLRELCEAVVAIEPMIARLAAEKLDGSIIAQIDENVRKTELAVNNGQRFVGLDDEFHALIAMMSANRPLNIARGPIGNLFTPVYDLAMSRTPLAATNMVRDHRAIADALRKEDADEAESRMREHVDGFKRELANGGVSIDMPISLVAKLARFNGM